MTKLKRYKLRGNRESRTVTCGCECPDGKWVLFSDHEKETDFLNAELQKRLAQEMEFEEWKLVAKQKLKDNISNIYYSGNKSAEYRLIKKIIDGVFDEK